MKTKGKIDFHAANLAALHALTPTLKKVRPTREGLIACAPYRDDKKPSLAINTTKLLYNDFGTGEGGDILKLYILNAGQTCDSQTRVETARRLNGKAAKSQLSCLPVPACADRRRQTGLRQVRRPARADLPALRQAGRQTGLQKEKLASDAPASGRPVCLPAQAGTGRQPEHTIENQPCDFAPLKAYELPASGGQADLSAVAQVDRQALLSIDETAPTEYPEWNAVSLYPTLCKERGQPDHEYVYRDRVGIIYQIVFRWDAVAPAQVDRPVCRRLSAQAGTGRQDDLKKTIRPIRYNCALGKWEPKAYKNARGERILYGLDRIKKGAIHILAEGEKAADALLALGYVALGYQKNGTQDFTPLKDEHVIVFPDLEREAIKAARAVAEQYGFACITWDDLTWIDAGLREGDDPASVDSDLVHEILHKKITGLE